MRITLLGIIAALVFSASALYAVNGGYASQPAAAGTAATQAALLFDTSRVVELLKALLALRSASPPKVTVPFATTTQAIATTSAPVVKKPVAAPATKAVVTVPVVTTSVQQSATERALGLVLPQLRSALVNIVCLPRSDGGILKGISGSGIIIDSSGIILTVAHVAQYELLAETRPDLMNCVVRTGSPALNAYRATPLYVSGAWIRQNSQTISTQDPRGTGENDFALLAITGSASNSPLPASFPSVPLSGAAANVGDPVVIGSYGAEFLTTARIRSDLFPTLVFDTVHDRFTFGTNTVDVVSLGGGAAAQQGSSGGGIMTQDGKLEALITTSSSGATLNARDLHAITSTYIQRAFKQEMGTDLSTYVSNQNLSTLVNSYAGQANTLASILLNANGLK